PRSIAAGKPPPHCHAIRRIGSQRGGPRGPVWPKCAGGLCPDQADQGGLAGVCRAAFSPGGPIMTPLSDADRLQAYLDGRLSTADVPAVEARLQTEPQLADALLTLAREEAILTEWARAVSAAEGASREEPALAGSLSARQGARHLPAGRRLRLVS